MPKTVDFAQHDSTPESPEMFLSKRKMYSIDSSSWEAEQGCPHYVALKAMGL